MLDAVYSPDGKRVALIAGGDSRSSLQLYDAATWKPVALPGLPATGEVSAVAFSRDGKSLAFLASGERLAARRLALRPRQAGRAAPAVWRSRRRRGGWVAGEVKRFKSFDQQEIPGILFKPGGGLARATGAGGGLGPRRPERPGAARFRSAGPDARRARVRGLRDQSARQLRLRQDVPAARRPAARARRTSRTASRRSACSPRPAGWTPPASPSAGWGSAASSPSMPSPSSRRSSPPGWTCSASPTGSG